MTVRRGVPCHSLITFIMHLLNSYRNCVTMLGHHLIRSRNGFQ
ncbi:unnamed protein product, partial [Ectocarpus sp. 4 AP-2014]